MRRRSVLALLGSITAGCLGDDQPTEPQSESKSLTTSATPKPSPSPVSTDQPPSTTSVGGTTETPTKINSPSPTTSPTATETPHPPKGPIKPAGGIVSTSVLENKVRVRTQYLGQNTEVGQGYVDILERDDADDAVTLTSEQVRSMPALQNGLAYVGYERPEVNVYTSRERAGTTAEILREIWNGAGRTDSSEERFQFESFVFEVGVTVT